MTQDSRPVIGQRFRGFLPVVVDVETAGFNAQTDALLEIACIPIIYDEEGKFIPGPAYHAHINPFEGANLDRRSLDFIGVDPFNPMRMAMAEDEKTALKRIFKSIHDIRREQLCTHAILVGHNAHFDLGFYRQLLTEVELKTRIHFIAFQCLIRSRSVP